MPTYNSARGQKNEEVHHRPLGSNTIATVSEGGGTQMAPAYQNCTSIDVALKSAVAQGNGPLLWTYSQPDDNHTQVKFGFDKLVPWEEGQKKIGHVALTERATISGEIYQSGAQWRINNESGAWGNMGGDDGKSRKMIEVAQFMSQHCGGMVVTSDTAYSRHLWKRELKKWYQRNEQTLQGIAAAYRARG